MPSSLRAFFLLGSTLIVLLGGFLLYLTFQPRPKAAETSLKLHPAPLIEGGRSGAFNSGQGVWVKKYDTNGQLSSQLRAVQYDPVGPDTIHVTRPEARFFLNDGQILRITGAEGTVMTESAAGAPNRRGIAGAPTEMPRHGRLEQVKLELYTRDQIHRLDDNLPAHANLTATMNNAVFDANASRIYTDDCTLDGRHVPGHQVPVQVIGDDYDFFGQGLLVRWNEQLHQLTLLEVHKGQSLTLKHPGRMQAFNLQGPEPRASASGLDGGAAASPPDRPQPGGRTTLATSQPADKNAQGTPYRATFEQNVRIEQGNQLLAKAMIMQVDFMPRPQKNETSSETSPHPASAPEPPGKEPATSQPSPAPAPSAEQPIVIHWTGPLRVTPLPQTQQEPLTPGQTAVRLLGAPVTLTHENGTLTASSVYYRASDQSVELHGLLQSPVVMTDGRGSTITTQSMIYRPRQHEAELFGNGHASGLADTETLDARWSKQATLHFRPGAAQDQTHIESVALRGDVRIDHPQLKLQSDRLDLAFAPPAAAPQDNSANALQSLAAQGHVQTRLLDKQNGEQRLEAGKLHLTMAHSPTGQSYPRVVQADEQVHAHWPAKDQQLWADHLTVHLQPATDSKTTSDRQTPQIALQSLDARGQVRLKDPRSSAEAGELTVVMVDNHPTVTLKGQPAHLSGPNGDHLAGPVIHYAPQEHQASVVGPGQLTATQQAGAGTRPLHVTWTDAIQMDGDTNRIDITGQVVTTSSGADGAVQTAKGDNLTLWLVDSARKPSTQPALPSQSLAGMDNNFMEGKEVRRAEFTGHASLQSLLSREDKVLRRLYLQAPHIEYDLPAQRLVVPTAGQMLVEDHQSTQTPSTTASSPRGNTAFAWSKQLIFDQSAHQATLSGDVHIVHQPDAQTSGLPFALQSQEVIARFAPRTDGGISPNSGVEGNIQLKNLVARDHVVIDSQGRQIRADRISYDPSTGLLDAVGSSNDPVRLRSDDGSVRGQFESLTYDLKLDKIVKMENAQFRGRR